MLRSSKSKEEVYETRETTDVVKRVDWLNIQLGSSDMCCMSKHTADVNFGSSEGWHALLTLLTLKVICNEISVT